MPTGHVGDRHDVGLRATLRDVSARPRLVLQAAAALHGVGISDFDGCS
ncbi:MAG TPA: hypothetical protein VK922_04405 [Gemmatimonadaceae bacterium]|nr:hypothetical protein [Gemmatimonadaceae bacterium]